VGPTGAFVLIHAGAGGAEAEAWARMVSTLYARFGARRGWDVIPIDTAPTPHGLRHDVLMVAGEGAHAALAGEQGVHSLVRVPPGQERRHMSFVSLRVLPLVDAEPDLDQDDLALSTCPWNDLPRLRAAGQALNYREPGVEILHVPSGARVRARHERSQHENRAVARRLLAATLAAPAEPALEPARAIVLHPYTRASDPRTGCSTEDAAGVLDGDLDGFVQAWRERGD
jgi:peptide chain release factor 2